MTKICKKCGYSHAAEEAWRIEAGLARTKCASCGTPLDPTVAAAEAAAVLAIAQEGWRKNQSWYTGSSAQSRDRQQEEGDARPKEDFGLGAI